MESTANPFETINKELADIKMMISANNALKTELPPDPPSKYVNLDQFIAMHPARPAKQTIYNWVNRKQIKCLKSAGKLLFLRSEVEQFINDSIKERE